ncbi:tudor domain-containing protein 5-like [Helicoverpa zea]|uniref:tudor domain-containing protein 5-like n=1 Tax=Helicoverpa zea TaxID=7113 RepID=UPI001F5AB431|nr:tudor domain-containing protein 5-like [Helicoverpa zea]
MSSTTNTGEASQPSETKDSPRTRAIRRAKRNQRLKAQVMDLITANPGGVWMLDLLQLYRKRFKRNMNFLASGHLSLLSLLCLLDEHVVVTCLEDGSWFVHLRGAEPEYPPVPAPSPRPVRASTPVTDEDALPYIPYDEDVFPEDCMQPMEVIPESSLRDIQPADMVEISVTEVYSPSHFWLMRLGEEYHIALEIIMDEMARYYDDEGRSRFLAPSAMRVGHYCSAPYERRWHRAVIVQLKDSDIVKVRYVDYGTVESLQRCELRPLRREWAQLPAQALRARLAAVRPCADATRWPFASSAHFLKLVANMRLVANVVSVNTEEKVIETLLVDTSTPKDLLISDALIKTGHADARHDSVRASEPHLIPTFEALESGAALGPKDVMFYLNNGVPLEKHPAYVEHVIAPIKRATITRDEAPGLTRDSASEPSTPGQLLLAALQVGAKSSSSLDEEPRSHSSAPLGERPLCSSASVASVESDIAALTLEERDTYNSLLREDPVAAHWYKAGALGRAMHPE